MIFTVKTEWFNINPYYDSWSHDEDDAGYDEPGDVSAWWFVDNDGIADGVCCAEQVEYHFDTKLNKDNRLRFAASNVQPEKHDFWTIEECLEKACYISSQMEYIIHTFNKAGAKFVWMELE